MDDAKDTVPYWDTGSGFDAMAAELRARLAQDFPAEAAEFMFVALYALLTRFAVDEEWLRVPCERERRLIADLTAFSDRHGVAYAAMTQFYVTRILSRRRYDAMTINGPSLGLGIGDGVSAAFALDGRCMTVGSDLFAHDVEAARKFHSFECYMAFDMSGIPFDDGAFKTVCCDYALYHARSKHLALAEIARVTAPGGSAYFDDIAAPLFDHRPLSVMLGAVGLDKGARAVRHSQTRQQDSFSRDGYGDLLSDLGFATAAVTPVFSVPLYRVTYLLYDLERLFRASAASAIYASALGEFLFAVIAPMLALDATLCERRGAVFWAVQASK